MRRPLRLWIAVALTVVLTPPSSAQVLFKTIPALSFSVEGPAQTIGTFVSSLVPGQPGGAPGHFARYCDGYRCSFFADPRVPNGATVVGMEIDACNTSGTQALLVSFIKVNSNETLSGGTNAYEIVDEFLVGPMSGCDFFFYQITPSALDLFNFTYQIVVTVPVFGPVCGGQFQPPCPDSETRFSAVRVIYNPNTEGSVEPTKPAG